MATAVVRSIGSVGRDYATPQLFEDAIPADIVASDETWTGEMYNDSEFTSKTSFSGTVTDATRWIKLTTAPGESFVDHVDAATNPLKYDASKGVAISASAGYSSALSASSGYYLTIEKIQVKNGTSNTNRIISVSQNTTVKNVIAETNVNRDFVIATTGSNCKATNCLAITRATTRSAFRINEGSSLHNCTAVSPSDITNSKFGVETGYGSSIVQNVAAFGFSAGFESSGFSSSSEYNATDSSSAPGSNNQVNLVYADQFEDVTTAAYDYRVKTGSDLENNGTRDQANTNDLDIIGQARSTATPTIGCWEFIATSGTTTGTGSLVAAIASITGVGERTITGSSSLAATTATITGSGTSSAGVTGTGTLAAAVATLIGIGNREIVSTAGTLNSITATLNGSGIIGRKGTGTLVATIATITGTGSIGGSISGTGNLTSSTATLSGSGIRAIIGTSILTTATASISGTGSRNLTGTAVLTTSQATLTGTGIRSLTGTGTLISTTALISGSGTTPISGSGVLLSSTAQLSGIAERIITGTGSLIANTAIINSPIAESAGTGGGGMLSSLNVRRSMKRFRIGNRR